MRAMLRAALIAACFLLYPFGARGADLEGVPPLFPSEAPAVQHNRTALYAGVLVGEDIANLEAAGVQISDTSVMGGGFIGYNHRFAGLVVGVEGDYVFTDIKAALGAGVFSGTNHYLASLRARAGIPIGPTLLYATAGPAFTSSSVTVGGLVQQQDLVGAAFGAGIEAELSKALFVRLEALHYAFPEQDLTPTLSAKTEQNVIRAGLGLKF